MKKIRFERMLAKRYIFAQKRHSVLTICSIVIAVALMTMIFTSYSTLKGIQRAAHFDSAPYHMEFRDVTNKQAQYLSSLPEVGSFEKIVNDAETDSYTVRLMFAKYIDDDAEYLRKIVTEGKLSIEVPFLFSSGQTLVTEEFANNQKLMQDDLVTLAGRASAATSIALLMIFVIIVALALRMIIDTAFEVSSKERERQFGVLQSIGATPKQVVNIITQEGMILSLIGVPVGAVLGIGLGYGAYKAVLTSGVANVYFTAQKAKELVQFHINPLMILAGMLVGAAWVFFSAYGTGMRIIKMSPIQAITSRSNTVKKVRKHSLLGLLFGWKGKMASRNARRQKKRFVITVFSLTVSLVLFAGFSSVITTYGELVKLGGGAWDFLGPARYDLDIGEGVQKPDFMVGYDDSDLDAGTEGIDETQEAKQEQAYQDYLRRESDFVRTIDYTDVHRYEKYAAELEKTGYFSDVQLYALTALSFSANHPIVAFGDASTYNRIYDGKPPMSFAEFEKSGKAAVRGLPEDTKTVRFNIRLAFPYTGEVDPDDRSVSVYCRCAYDEDGNPYENFNQPTKYAKVAEEREITVEIGDVISERFQREGQALIFLPYSYFTDHIYQEGAVADCSVVNWMHVTCKDAESYRAAKDFFKQNGHLCLEEDFYQMRQTVDAVIAAIAIGVTVFLIMVALIALVNMINIVSTGILNRRQELGALRCLGMTEGQLSAETLCECIQFVLFAGIAATVICVLLIFGTKQFVLSIGLEERDIAGLLPKYSDPVIRVWASVIAAFAAAVAASFIPLSRMRKEPLIDQIRTVE